MLGALAGDIIGSVHQFLQEQSMHFPLFVEHSRFTDDSVLTIAVADCLLTGSSYVDKFHDYTRAYPDRCYGAGFRRWVESGSREPYNSWGNGAAMRVSPVGFALHTLDGIRSTAFVRPTPSTSLVREPCPRQSSRSSTPLISRKRSG